MYFTWKNTPYGLIRISENGFRDFLGKLLSPLPEPRLVIHSLSLEESGYESGYESELDALDSLEPDNNARLVVVLCVHGVSPNDSLRDKLDEYLSAIFKPMGIIISLVWAEPEKNFLDVLLNPWIWAIVVSSVTMIISSGAENFFWAAFWGTFAWFTARVLSKLNIMLNT